MSIVWIAFAVAGLVVASPLGASIGDSRSTAAMLLLGGALVGRLVQLGGRLRREQEAVRYLSHHDELTRLPNRTLLGDRLVLELAHSRRSGESVAVVAVNLDRFTTVNDSLGHGAGDDLLRQVAARLQTTVRGSDTVPRVGADEFVLLLTMLRGADDVAVVAQRVFGVLDQPFAVAGQEVHASCCLGAALFPHDGQDAPTLLRNAGAALHRAKERGKGSLQLFDQTMNARAVERLTLEQGLRRALDRGELEPFYQPQIDAVSGRIVGMEVLLRWRHPDRGLVAPADFIPIAEETGLIDAIGDWVLESACRQARKWQEQGFAELHLAVNVSARQLKDGELPTRLGRVLERSGLDPRHLELEITEAVLVGRDPSVLTTLQQVRRLGVRIAIDDFGTGYSSLAYLKQFPVDCLKIDRVFICDLSTDDGSEAIVKAIVAIAQSLGLRVVAEGVETQSQAEMLSALGSTEMQGFLFSRPVPVEQATAWLSERWGRARRPD